MTRSQAAEVGPRRYAGATRGPLLALLAAGVVVSVIVSVGLGSVYVPPGTVVAIVLDSLWPSGGAPTWTTGQFHIVVDLRIPRAILGAFCGAGLAATGAVLQNITRNPLADPYLFGVSSGASLGAVIVILYTGALIGVWTLPLAAFSGALLAMLMVFALARETGGFATERLVLTGLAVYFVLMAATNGLIFASGNRGAESAVFWMLGGLGNTRWHLLPAPILAVTLGIAWILFRARALDAISLGDETAHTLGVAVPRLRMEMFLATSLITGVLVSASGAIGFIGLVIPHCARWIAGAEMSRAVPVAALVGAVFTVWVDAAARLILAPSELPLGVATAAIGGLFFMVLLRRREVLA